MVDFVDLKLREWEKGEACYGNRDFVHLLQSLLLLLPDTSCCQVFPLRIALLLDSFSEFVPRQN